MQPENLSNVFLCEIPLWKLVTGDSVTEAEASEYHFHKPCSKTITTMFDCIKIHIIMKVNIAKLYSLHSSLQNLKESEIPLRRFDSVF